MRSPAQLCGLASPQHGPPGTGPLLQLFSRHQCSRQGRRPVIQCDPGGAEDLDPVPRSDLGKLLGHSGSSLGSTMDHLARLIPRVGSSARGSIMERGPVSRNPPELGARWALSPRDWPPYLRLVIGDNIAPPADRAAPCPHCSHPEVGGSLRTLAVLVDGSWPPAPHFDFSSARAVERMRPSPPGRAGVTLARSRNGLDIRQA